MNTKTAFEDNVKTLRYLPMTDLEEQLKLCAQQRPDLKNKILSAAQMSAYIIWMVQNFGAGAKTRFSNTDIPPMLVGGAVSEIGHHILHNPGDNDALKELATIYEKPTESHFFSEGQDISASRSLRYLPAYWRTDNYFEVYYVFSGQCPVMFEQETVLMKPGTVLIVPPSAPRAYTCPADDCVMFFYMIRSSTFSQVFWSHLSNQNLMSMFFKQALSGKGNTSYLQFNTAQDNRVESLLYDIYDEYLSDNTYSSQMQNALMSTFFLLLLQRYEHTVRVSKKKDFYWKPEFLAMFNYIQTNYQSATLKELADKFNYSERQIIRIIQNCTGKKFNQLLLQLRMEKAAQMIIAQSASISVIAAEAGYSTVSSFHRAFTQYYDCTPGTYRQSCQETQNSFD